MWLGLGPLPYSTLLTMWMLWNQIHYGITNVARNHAVDAAQLLELTVKTKITLLCCGGGKMPNCLSHDAFLLDSKSCMT